MCPCTNRLPHHHRAGKLIYICMACSRYHTTAAPARRELIAVYSRIDGAIKTRATLPPSSIARYTAQEG